MSHLEHGTITAIRDGALVTGDAREHLGGCPRCRAELERAGRRADRIATALAGLDVPVDTASAKAAVRRRLDARRDRDSRPERHWRRHLGRAAAIVLATAGAAYAVPGSPVREILRPVVVPVAPGPTESAATQEAPQEGGIAVSVPDGRIRVLVRDAAPGTEIEVVWVDAASARVLAAPGSSFSFGEGRAEATVAPGPVRVHLPRFAPDVTLEVDGRPYLRRAATELELLERPISTSDDRIRFVVPGR